MTSPNPFAKAAAILPVLAFSTASLALDLSGRMVNLDSTAKAGVSVALKRSGVEIASTVTGADGAWKLDGAATGVMSRRQALEGRSGHLDLTRGRLSVAFDGRDLAGRSRGENVAMIRASAAARSAAVAVPDTLVYSIGDRIFLRDTISDTIRTGMGRYFDTTWNPAIAYGYLKDARDGNVYRTVKVGTQIWMAQNLAFKRDTSWRYRDSLELERRYGRLYQWSAAMDTSGKFNTDVAEIELPWRGVCPAGWHIPSDAEWSVLVNAVDSARSGTLLKAQEFALAGSATKPSDSLGFRVMPGGQAYWKEDGVYRYVYTAFGTNTYFWSASEMTTIRSWGRSFGSSIDNSTRSLYLKTNGHSVRCLKD